MADPTSPTPPASDVHAATEAPPTAPPADDDEVRPLRADVPPRPAALTLGAILAGVLLLTVVVSLVLQEHNRNRAVPVDDWQAAAAYIRQGYTAGDVVRVEPRWADTPRVFLDGATFDLAPDPQRDILDEFHRVWVLAGFNRADIVRQEMPDLYDEIAFESFGRVDVLLFEIPTAARPRFDFSESLAEAVVRRTWPDGRPPQRCTLWRDDAWHCGHVDQHLFVGRRVRDMNDEPRHCIYAPPIPDLGRVEITWPSVELGSELSGRVGHDNWAVRSHRGSESLFEVLIDGELRFQTVLGQRDPTFHPWTIDTTDRAGQRASVTFRTHAVDFFDRFVCFTARIPAP